MSRYDTIKTPADLIVEVKMHGLSTEQEDINRAADIFGHASIEELAELANGRPETSSKFYFIAYQVWGWEQATRFFNEHTNPATKAAKETADELKKAKEEIKTLTAERDDAKHTIHEVTEQKIHEHSERVHAATALKAAQEEILTLKAKLYDLMTAGA